MPRPVHFEIHTANPQRAIEFYEGMFGWRFNKWEGPADYWIIDTTDPKRPDEPGINGGMVMRMGGPPVEGAAVNAWVCTVGIGSVDESVATAQRLGGTVALPKMPVPGVGWLAYVKDVDGNILGLMQNDPKAG
jgi:predicted enzyme related to lactoylglutathione lyase